MTFYHEPEPERGHIHPVAPGISRMVANNPSKMTYHGTNTYLIKAEAGTYVLDPGPVQDEVHFNALLKALEPNPAGIIVSHHHSDHFGSVPRLKAATGLPVFASSVFADDTFRPDVALDDGDTVAEFEVMHTPGHASDHLCFGRDDGLVFTGDHVMTWSSSMIMLPDGDMQAYCWQLARLLARADKLYLPGHGPVLDNPLPYTRRLLDHREKREKAILDSISKAPATTTELSTSLYGKTDPHLAWAAERNVEAHLEKLRREERAINTDNLWRAV